MPLVPFMRSPLTDLTGTLLTAQHFGNCSGIEMRMINCLEAYGMERGFKKCSELIDDYFECFDKGKQAQRIQEMQQERIRQQKVEGKNPAYLPEPRLDSYQ